MTKRFKPFATVALIIEHEGKFLMVEEYDEYGKIVFGMPAGHIEAKESILEAASREGHEETGCQVKLEALSGIYDYVKAEETILRFCFTASIPDLPAIMQAQDPDHEILNVKWYSAEEIFAKKADWRTRLVGLCMQDYLDGKRYPLSLIEKVVP